MHCRIAQLIFYLKISLNAFELTRRTYDLDISLNHFKIILNDLEISLNRIDGFAKSKERYLSFVLDIMKS